MSIRDVADVARALISEPVEDSGTDTASRYNFQYQCAARHCFAMLNDSKLERIVCEWHVDYVLVYSDGQNELVSVKHREPHLGPWAFADLWKKGGLATLYKHWRGAQQAKCRLVTNGSMKSMKDKARAFAKALSGQLVDEFVPEVANYLECDTESAHGFLLSLRIEHGVPDRVVMRSHQIVNVVESSLLEAHIEHVGAAQAWDTVVNLVAKKSRDDDNRDFSSINLASPNALNAEVLTSSKVARRTIKRDDVSAVLSAAPESNEVEYPSISNLWRREPSATFVGREGSIQEISDRFDTDTPQGPALTVVGMSGVGKSEVLAQYAWSHAVKYSFIWWVRGDSWHSIISDLASLAQEIGLPSPDSEKGLQRIKHYFRNNRGLILIDGAPKERNIANLIPKVSATRFLISSLDQSWATHTPVIQLAPLADGDANSLLATILAGSSGDLTALNAALGGLPLALKQAAGYINSSGIPIELYSGMVHDRARELLSRAAPPEHLGLAAALSITIERLRESHQSAFALLRTLSFLAPHGFPTEIFGMQITSRGGIAPEDETARRATLEMEQLAANEIDGLTEVSLAVLNDFKDHLALFDAVADLQRFSIIETQPSGVSCHALTQAVVRQSLTGMQVQSAIEVGTALLSKVTALSPLDARYWPHYRHMMPHFETLLSHLESRPVFAANALKFYLSIAMHLGTQGNKEANLSYAEKAVKAAESLELAGVNTNSFARTVLIEALTGMDRWGDAMRIANESLLIAENAQADWFSMSSLHVKKAAILQLEGKLAEAIVELDKADFHVASNEDLDETLMPRHVIRASRAALRREGGDAQGAVSDFEALIVEYPENASRNGLAALYSNLALAYLDLTDFARSLGASRKALDLDYEDSDGFHRDGARDWNNAGLALLELNKPSDAAAAFGASLRIHEVLSDKASTRYLIVRMNLGRAQLAQEDYVTARKTFEETLSRQEEILGPDHREVAATLANLSVVYSALRLFGDAVKAAHRAFKIDVAVYGEDHPELVPDYNNLGGALMLAGSHRAALKWFGRAYELARHSFGEPNLRVALCLQKVAICKYNLGMDVEAIESMQEAVAMLDATVGAKYPEAEFSRSLLRQMRQGRRGLNFAEI
ncbi:dsDNA nuclease domain-containing protein [Streptomyces sp. CA2R101]|uniref:dsDNA nuclease domain-containing protein n=1 Tax=Streptomyces sp. CA2R101 TaxID=3120152 RepID=UPI00300A4A02